MSSTLRLSIIVVLLLATAALGLMAYTMNQLKPVVQVTESPPAPAPRTVEYFVAARALPRGTLARDEDFSVRSVASDRAPTGAIYNTPDAKIELRGSLVSKFLDAGSPVTLQDVLRPRDRGFLASVLAPDTRAVSIKVDAESGVSGLIWPGDYVDVVSTQATDKAGPAQDTLSETVLHDVRIVAIDQEMGVPANAMAGKLAQTVSLQLAPEQVKKIVVAGQRGKLSLAVRSAVTQPDTGDTDTTVVVYAGDKVKKYSVKKHDSENTVAVVRADASRGSARQSATAVAEAGDKAKDPSVQLLRRQW